MWVSPLKINAKVPLGAWSFDITSTFLLIDNDEDSHVQVHFVLLKERGRDRNEDGKHFGVGFGGVFDKKKMLTNLLY